MPRSSRTLSSARLPTASPFTGTESSARSPDFAVCAWTGPNAGSPASSFVRRVIAAWTAGVFALPSTTICTGFTPPAENCFSSTAKPCLLSKLLGNVLTPETPVFMSRAG